MLEVLSKIGFDWQVALANFINFVIIFLILKRFAFGPIQKLIKDRQTKIDEGLENAQKAETALLMAEELKNQKLEDARLKGNQIISTAQIKSDEILTEVKTESLKLKTQIIKEGEHTVAETKQRLHKEIEREMGKLILQGVEKVLKENMTPEMQNNYIKKSLSNYAVKK